MVKINLGGIVPFSTIDWRGKAAMVIFLRGCPLRCMYCQNYNLLEGTHYVEMEELEEEILKNEDFIDAVVLSGGEPFMQPHALEAISHCAKKHSLFVAVQTNGFYPAIIKSMLKRKLIDKILLDIKAPLLDERLYENLTTVAGVAGGVKNTLDVCIHASIDLELVTTVFKNLVGSEEVKRIAKDIEEAGAAGCPYVIQQGRAEHVLDKAIKEDDMFSHEELKELAAGAYHAADLKEVRIRTREGGEEVIYRRS
ncbi:MAG: anaerobic ribonucleoside-triphosphate reductase activating protein [archaeon]|nr:anaerobic ribonucleoside-triphosphate reductase activating protein [archaeon]